MYATRHYNHEYRNTILKFHAAGEKDQKPLETEKCQVVIQKRRVICAMQFFDAKVDKELIQEWTDISRQLGSSSQKNYSGTDGACVRLPWWCYAAGSSPKRAKHRRKGKLR